MPKSEEDEGYSAQEMRNWLKSRGYDVDTPGGKTPDAKAVHTDAPADAVAPPATPTATAAPGASPGVLAPVERTITQAHHMLAGEGDPGKPPTYDQMDWQQKAAQGAARRGAQLVTGAGKLASQLVPTSVRRTLGQLAEQAPGVKRMEDFAAADAEGPMEYLGMGAMDVASAGLTPSFGLGSLAAKAVPATRTIPTMTMVPGAPTWVNPLGAGGRWMQTAPRFVAGTTKVANPGTVKTARAAGNFAENVGKGAVGGMVTDPDDPKTGAEAGAGTSVAAQAVGRALSGPRGQHLLGSLARYIPSGAAYFLLHKLGHEIAAELTAGGMAAKTFAHGIAHDIRGYSSPTGRYLRGVGEAAGRNIGGFLQRAAPAGLEGGEVAKKVSPSDATDAAKDWYDKATEPPRAPAAKRSIYHEMEREDAE